MKKEILTHLTFAFIFSIPIIFLHWQLKFSLIFFFLGLFFGSLFLDIDHLLYALFQAPYEFTSQRIKRFFDNKQFKEGIVFLFETQKERTRLVFHSVLFQVILLVVCFFILTSSLSLFGKGMVLGMMLHLLIDQAEEFLRDGEIKNWFWQFRVKPDKSVQKFYLSFVFLIFLIFCLVLF